MSTNLPEEWRPIPDYEGYYEVSNLGNVRSVDRIVKRESKFGILKVKRKGILRKQTKNQQGYYMVFLSKDSVNTGYTVHVLVAKAFLPPCPGNHGCGKGDYNVDHINEIKTDNRACNLQWLLAKDNTLKGNRIEHKTPMRGEQHPFSIFTDEDIIKIRKDLRTAKEIAKDYNVTEFTIYPILKGKIWKHIPFENKEEQKQARRNNAAKGSRNGSSVLTEEDVAKIKRDKRRQIDIAKDYGVLQTTISKIKCGVSWKHVP